MNPITRLCLVLALHCAVPVIQAQSIDTNRLRELRMRMRDGTLTPEEKTELDKAMEARDGARTPPTTPTPPKPEPGNPEMPPKPKPGKPAEPMSRDEMRKKRMDEYEVQQEFVFERSRQQQKVVLDSAAARKLPQVQLTSIS